MVGLTRGWWRGGGLVAGGVLWLATGVASWQDWQRAGRQDWWGLLARSPGLVIGC